MQYVQIDAKSAKAFSGHGKTMRKLGMPLTESRMTTLFAKAIASRVLTYQEWFILTKIIEEDIRYAEHMDGVCASLGATPQERLRRKYARIAVIREILEKSRVGKTERERVRDFYRTIGVSVLEDEYAGHIIRDYLGPEKDFVYKLLKELLEVRESVDILDVGFGRGRYLIPFSKEDRLRVIGIDYSLLMELLTLRIAQLQGGVTVDARAGDATRIEFLDRSFDLTMCMYNTLGNIPQELQALREMRRVTRKGGLIVLSVCSDKSLDHRLEMYERMGLTVERIEDGKVYTKEGLTSKGYTREALERVLNETGLDVGLSGSVGFVDAGIFEVGVGYVAVVVAP